MVLTLAPLALFFLSCLLKTIPRPANRIPWTNQIMDPAESFSNRWRTTFAASISAATKNDQEFHRVNRFTKTGVNPLVRVNG